MPVYTRDSIVFNMTDDDKQAVIDGWTDELASRMAGNTRVVMLDDGTIEFGRYSKRGGGHNKHKVEMLNDEGYVVRVFESITEAAEYFGLSSETIISSMDGKRKSPLKPGYTLRRRETDKQRKEREKATAKATKKRKKTIINKNKNKNKAKMEL